MLLVNILNVYVAALGDMGLTKPHTQQTVVDNNDVGGEQTNHIILGLSCV